MCCHLAINAEAESIQEKLILQALEKNVCEMNKIQQKFR